MFDFNLDDVLTTPTQHRSEVDEENEKEFDLSGLVFEDNEEEENLDEIDSALNPNAPPVEKVKLITEKEAYDGAKALIDLYSMMREGGLTRLAKWKMKKKLGSDKVLKKMKLLEQKELLGDDELTEKEKVLLKKLKAYEKKTEGIKDIVTYDKEAKENLTKSLAKYFFENQIKFKGQDSFWVQFILIESFTIGQVLMM